MHGAQNYVSPVPMKNFSRDVSLNQSWDFHHSIKSDRNNMSQMPEDESKGAHNISIDKVNNMDSSRSISKSFSPRGREDVEKMVDKLMNKLPESKVENPTECMMCFTKEANTIFQPCGHGGVCFDCAIEIMKNGNIECHYCRGVTAISSNRSPSTES